MTSRQMSALRLKPVDAVMSALTMCLAVILAGKLILIERKAARRLTPKCGSPAFRR